MTVNGSEDRPSRQRRYPPFWEKAVPILLAIIVVVIVVLLLIALAVVLGRFPGSA